MALNRGQCGALNVSCGIAYRAVLQLAAVLEIYEMLQLAATLPPVTC